MGRAPCCNKANVKRGSWSPDEDNTLRNYLEKHGADNWIALPRKAGLRRCGKSCRLRWLNYLRPNIKLGGFTEEEDNIICSLYSSIGSRWSVIAAQLPGRTDNDVKNYWNTKLKKKLLAGKVVVGLNQNIDNQITNTTTDNNLSSGEFSASFPTDQVLESRAQGDFSHHLMTAKGSTSVSTCMKEMKYEETYDYPLGTTIMDQIDQFPLPGLMEVPGYSPSTANNMSSSQEVSSLSNSSSFPMEINNYAMYSNGDGVFLDQLDFESSHYPLNGTSFQANTSEVAASFGNFSFTASMTNI